MPVLDDIYPLNFDHKNNYKLNNTESVEVRITRWYFPGLASTCAACVVTPLDLISTHMQTQRSKKSIWTTTKKVYSLRGLRGFYDGFSPSVLRQLTSTNIRFMIYERGKLFESFTDSFANRLALAGVAGLASAFVALPFDVVNIRMQNDMKLPVHLRRNYKHVVDAWRRIFREAGVRGLYKGFPVALIKAAIGTCGSIPVYDQVKILSIRKWGLDDDVYLHLSCATIASIVTAVVSQPLDVMKTLLMSAQHEQRMSTMDSVHYMLRFGPLGMFRGLSIGLARKAPATVVLFVVFEQLRLNFGIVIQQQQDPNDI